MTNQKHYFRTPTICLYINIWCIILWCLFWPL